MKAAQVVDRRTMDLEEPALNLADLFYFTLLLLSY